MGFRINTNIAAMNAHRNSTQTNLSLDKSLNSLSSGLRINTAADDASGMTIADSLRSQAQGLGQAINNANDGVAVVQTADGALDEYVKIINTVRTKSIQAASDGQNADSRQAIQKDIDRLLEAADKIANTTQFNGQKLLDGTFTNKSFHIGAYANETVDLSVNSVQIDSVGAIKSTTDNSTFTSTLTGASTNLQKNDSGAFTLQDDFLKINGVDVTSTLEEKSAYALLDAKNVADAITEATGVTATAETTLNGTSAVSSGTISNSDTNYLKINGVNVGAVDVLDDDSNKALSSAINAISDQTGVSATVSDNGILQLESADGSNISIDAEGNGSTLSSLLDNATNTDSAAIGGLASSVTSSYTLEVGELVVNGVDLHGTYGDGVTAGDAAAELEKAIQAIEGLSATSIANDGTITFENNEGGDVNVSSTDSAIVAVADQGIRNSSAKGTITMYSDTLVRAEARNEDVLGFKDGTMLVSEGKERLDTIDVTTREAAELSIMITDSALKQLDATRSDLGSVQNQLESTIRNISVTQVNVTSAESQIRDVDFAAESANFAKLNILAQSGTYALSQANAVQQNVMRLLQ